MFRKFAALSTAVAACALAACGGGGMGHGTSNPGALPMTVSSFQIGDDLVASVKLPKDTIGEELPTEGVGTQRNATWGMIGGFTQMTYAQVLAFPPGTKITVHNLSKTTEHTFNVVGKTKKAPARFPAGQPSFTPSGDKTLVVGFASGPIKPGKSITVTLAKSGTFLIECAFHYKEGMRDVIIVEAKAKPGPQGTPIPKQTSNPTPTPGGGGSGW